MDSIDQVHESLLVEGEEDPAQNFVRYTGDGSFSFRGHPAVKQQTGNWRACSLIIVSSFSAYVAFSAITKNLVTYLTKVLHETNVVASRDVSTWQGTSFLAPVVGAFLADSYLGKYWTILLFYTIFIIGMVMLVLSAAVPLIFSGPSCLWPVCRDAISAQYVIVFIGLYMVALGSGGKSPCLTSFGADQFDDTNEEERTKKSSFFNWNYFALNVGSLISGTIIVWVQDHEGWLLGFTIPALCVGLGLGCFLLGSKVYRFQKPGGSPLARACQIVAAAIHNFNKDFPCDCSLLYELTGKGSAIKGSRKLEHTTGLKFFDRAAIVPSSDTDSAGLLNSWRICTVTQVEELKIFIRMLPIWATMVIFSAVMVQMFSTFVEQGMIMDGRIGSFQVPPASFQTVNVFSVLILVPVYERILIPMFRKFTGKANGISQLQRMGVGLFLSMLSMIVAALVERKRLEIARAEGLVHRKVAVPMSILWQAPQYFLIGASEVFANIGQNEFFYEQSPDAMRSLCLALALANISVGSYLNSFILFIVPLVTGGEGRPGWIPDNLNEGHLDRYFWMMAGLSFLNLLAFVFCAARYKCKRAS